MQLLLKSPRVNVSEIRAHDEATGLSQACQFGHYEVVKLLLEDWRICTTPREITTGCTPLWNAAHFGEQKIVEQLLTSEREIDTTTRSLEGDEEWNGTTPGEIAGSEHFMSFVLLLHEAEDISTRKQRNGKRIEELMNAHERDPRGVRHQLREKSEYRGQMISSSSFSILETSSSFSSYFFSFR